MPLDGIIFTESMSGARQVTRLFVRGSGFPFLATEDRWLPSREEAVLYSFGNLSLSNIRLTIGTDTYLVKSVRAVEEPSAKKWSFKFIIGALLLLLGIGWFSLSYFSFTENRQEIQKS